MTKVETLDNQIRYSLERILCLTIGGGTRAAIMVHVKGAKEHYARRALAVALEGGQ